MRRACHKGQLEVGVGGGGGALEPEGEARWWGGRGCGGGGP